MTKTMVKKIMTAVMTGTVACSLCGTALLANAAETGEAYVFIRDVAEEGVRYEGVDAAVNTIKDGATTVSVDKDGAYTVSIDLSKETAYETVDEISMLKLYVCGTDKTADATITVTDLKINGESVALSATPTTRTSGNDYYIDLCDTNGDELFNRTDYINMIQTIAIDFTVSGWPVEETTPTASETTATTTTTVSETTVTTTTTAATTKAPTPYEENNTPTGDGDVAAVGLVLAVTAAMSVLSVEKRK